MNYVVLVAVVACMAFVIGAALLTPQMPEKCKNITDRTICEQECTRYRVDCLVGTTRHLGEEKAIDMEAP